MKAILISQDAAQRTDELHVQLTVMQRQCTGRDRPICDTLRLKSFATDNTLVDSLIKVFFFNILCLKLNAEKANYIETLFFFC